MSSAPERFNEPLDRSGTNAVKWDYRPTNAAGTPILPMWVADMDFSVPPAVTRALARRVEHP
ncbi:MAG: aminotransferase, partial [Spirochaetota bacterium]